jgi:hypothetical protein
MTLPQAVVCSLRTGAHLALRAPIDELDAILGGREDRDPAQSLIDPYARLVQVCRLLDVLGWSAAEEVPESTIDLGLHGAGLAVALDMAMAAGLKGLGHPERQVCEQAHRAMSTLCGFAMVIDEEELHLSRSDPRVRAFRDRAELLWEELDRKDESARRGCCCS